MISPKECKDCCLSQVKRLGELLRTDDSKILELVEKTFKKGDLQFAPEYAELIFSEFEKQTGIKDPYKEIKEMSNHEALRLEPVVEKLLAEKMSGLRYYVELAIIGNMIDYGAFEDVDIEGFIRYAIGAPFFKFEFDKFKEDLSASKSILYIADNAGEIVFDTKLLNYFSEQGKKIYIAVRGGPVINDVTTEDALFCGLDKFAEIVSTGNSIPGIIMNRIDMRFKELMHNVDMIISKGQGNFETLYVQDGHKGGLLNIKNMYYLFVVKCPPVANMIGAKVRDKVLMKA